MKHLIIYVPGLGDHRSRGQTLAVKAWQIYGVKTLVVPMRWRTAEPLSNKLNRLVQAIDEGDRQGYVVSLVGVSAGASAVIHAYAARPTVIRRVVCICGKLRNPQTIHPHTYRLNPGFQESLELLPASLEKLSTAQRDRILSIRPHADGSVPPEDTIIPDAQAKVIPTSGHVVSIATAITIYSHALVRFLRSD